jgi:hypothetical protein
VIVTVAPDNTTYAKIVKGSVAPGVNASTINEPIPGIFHCVSLIILKPKTANPISMGSVLINTTEVFLKICLKNNLFLLTPLVMAKLTYSLFNSSTKYLLVKITITGINKIHIVNSGQNLDQKLPEMKSFDCSRPTTGKTYKPNTKITVGIEYKNKNNVLIKLPDILCFFIADKIPNGIPTK